MKEYLRCAFSISSILDDVINIFEPSHSTSDIFGTQCKFINLPMIKIEMQCPISCNLASVLGHIMQTSMQTKLTEDQIANSINDNKLKAIIIERIQYEVINPKLIFSFFLMLICVLLLYNGYITYSIIAYVVALVYIVIQSVRIMEFCKICNRYN